jgi:hypothetical protein
LEKLTNTHQGQSIAYLAPNNEEKAFFQKSTKKDGPYLPPRATIET